MTFRLVPPSVDTIFLQSVAVTTPAFSYGVARVRWANGEVAVLDDDGLPWESMLTSFVEQDDQKWRFHGKDGIQWEVARVRVCCGTTRGPIAR